MNIIMAMAFAAIIAGVSLFNAYSVDHGIVELSTEVTGHSAKVVAQRLQSEVERALDERTRSLTESAKKHSGNGKQLARLQQWVEHSYALGPELIWLGLMSNDGTPVAESGTRPSTLEMEYWSSRSGSLRSTVPSLALRGTARRTAGPENKAIQIEFVDISIPVIDADGRSSAFLCVRLSGRAINEILMTANQAVAENGGQTAIMVSASGEVLIGPAASRRLPAIVQNAISSGSNQNAVVRTTWDGTDAYVATHPQGGKAASFLSDEWRIVVRQPVGSTAVPLKKLHDRIWPWAIFFTFHGALLAWLAANAISAPLLRLANASDAIRRGDTTGNLPAEDSYPEVHRLSEALQSLITDLKNKERLQSELAGSLERQVMERTLELSERNQSLEVANMRAEEAVQSRSRFLAAASHDMRQPLQALTLIARRLGRRVKAGEDGELVARVEQSVDALTTMFNSLLDLTRLDSGIVEAREVPIALSGVLGAIAEDCKTQLAPRHIDFRYRCPEMTVLSDPVILETMVRNLCSNAVKFTPSGSILLCARRRGNQAAISVYDTGPGIDPEALPRIFAEFERSQRQADGPNQGLGLGLSIVSKYAKLVGAELSVRSVPRKGSCFTISVPRADGIQTRAYPRQQLDYAHYWNSRNVLLLDDDARVLEALKNELGDQGAHVAAFDSAGTAMCAVRDGLAIDVVIADYDLTGSDTGVQFLDRLHSERENRVASIILTGRTDAATIATISASGWSWLAKPAGSNAIAERLTGRHL